MEDVIESFWSVVANLNMVVIPVNKGVSGLLCDLCFFVLIISIERVLVVSLVDWWRMVLIVFMIRITVVRLPIIVHYGIGQSIKKTLRKNL